MKIDIVKIREQYNQNQVWEKETRDELKHEIVNMLGDKEWHFAPVEFSKDRTDKMAGARIVAGEVQFCSAQRGCWRCRMVNGKEERVATWRWLRFDYLHVSWWIKLYEILIAAKEAAVVCKQIEGCDCVAKTYAVPFEGESVSSIPKL